MKNISFLSENFQFLEVNFSIYLNGHVFVMSSHYDSLKKMAAKGRGLFSQFTCIENFKNLLV